MGIRGEMSFFGRKGFYPARRCFKALQEQNSLLEWQKLHRLHRKLAVLSTNRAFFKEYVWMGKEFLYICLPVYEVNK
ncbi:MAG: hypothetical protein WD577_06140 [Bacteroidales bacterium]